jgi:Flp pilus assembly protein TadG
MRSILSSILTPKSSLCTLLDSFPSPILKHRIRRWNRYERIHYRRLQQFRHPWDHHLASAGQAMVEFIIGLILLIIVAWIPADFGLAFYTSQIAQNAAREGARIAAADPTLVPINTTCNMPACYSFGNIFNETAARLPAALLTGASITVQYPSPASTGTCNQRVLVRVQGQYNFFFYRVLRLIGGPVPDSVTVNRTTELRWEHQPGCVGGGTP